jgi:hypothetical protein
MSEQRSGCLGAILGLFGASRSSEQGPSNDNDTEVAVNVYRLRDDFLSPAEASFFHVLQLAIGTQFVLCTKVGLGDLFYVTRPNENRAARNRITQSHVDFVLLDPGTLKPVAALELDDSSHQSQKAATRDEFKDRLFAAAGLPLVRVPVQRAYDAKQVAAIVSQAVAPPATTEGGFELPSPVEPLPHRDALQPPVCPRCEIPMVLRTAKQGTNAGQPFWGCANYPRCRAVVASETTP